MARRLRVDFIGAWHHVMNRARIGQVAFRNDQDRELFLELLAHACQKYGVEVHAYCLMDTHYHLVIRSSETGLSKTMQWLSANYTRRTNTKYGVDGSLFRGRFHSVNIWDSDHLINAVNYVHRNPQDISAVEALDSYDWSSFGAYRGKAKAHRVLHRDRIRDMINFRHRNHLRTVRRSTSKPIHQPRMDGSWAYRGP